MRHILIAGLIALSPTLAPAQSLSVADIQAQIDGRMNALNEYQVLLNNPDPARARMALEIMMTSGDAELERMAMEYGLFSTNKSVQIATLEAYLKTGPALELFLNSAGMDIRRTWYEQTLNKWGGDLRQDGSGYLRFKVGLWDGEQDCYLYFGSEAECFLSVTGTGVSLKTGGKWSSLTISNLGKLEGSIFVSQVGSVPTTIPIAR